MKKIVILVLLSVSVSLSAQTVSSVSYNPSRSGAYSDLKVADRVMFLGGLEATNLRILTAATLEWHNSRGNYQVTNLSGSGKFDFPSAVVTGYDVSSPSTYINYSAQNNAPSPSFGSGAALNFTLAGGTVTFKNDSYVGNIDNDTTVNLSTLGEMRLHANNVYLPATNSTVTVYGSSTAGESGNLVNGPTTKFFHLAGGDIPSPNAVSGTLGWCSKKACTAEACSGSYVQTVSVLCYK